MRKWHRTDVENQRESQCPILANLSLRRNRLNGKSGWSIVYVGAHIQVAKKPFNTSTPSPRGGGVQAPQDDACFMPLDDRDKDRAVSMR